ncbi:hypothetical protein FS842_005365, partial [Serendipita sp. 407]
MIKEWDDSLSLMLVFAALFSAVLTAFIIASIPLLTEEIIPGTNVILEIISHQLNDSSTPPYTYRDLPFQPPRWWAVQVNALFFTSLGCTLMTSLISVLCLQWIRDFDKGLASITNPADKALKRQFRLEGFKKWHIPTIIGVLPTLLVIALILFMAGIVIWLRGISTTVTAICCVILILGGGFYVFTGLCAAIFPSAPFNSSAARLLELLLLIVVRSFKSVYRHYFVSKASQDEWELTPSPSSKTTAFFAGHRHREDEAINLDPKLPSASLLWLLSHIDITNSTTQRLENILAALLNVDSPESMLDSYGKYKVPWSKILAFLADFSEVGDFSTGGWGDGDPVVLGDTLRLVFVPTCHIARLPVVSGRCLLPSSPAFTLAWLSELQTLLVRQAKSQEFVLEALIELCAAQTSDPLPFFTQDVSTALHPDVLRYVIVTTILMLTPTISRRSLSRAKAQPLDELLGTLASWYEYSKPKEDQHHHQHQKEIDLLMKHLVQGMLLEFGYLSMEVQIRAMRQIRRPSIQALVQRSPEPLYGIEGGSESTTTDHHYQYIESALQALGRGGACWADEISNLLFGYLRMTRKRGTRYTPRERIFSVEILFTVAYLSAPDTENEKWDGSALGRFGNGRDPLIVILEALSFLSSAMDTPSSAFLISSGIGS